MGEGKIGKLDLELEPRIDTTQHEEETEKPAVGGQA